MNQWMKGKKRAQSMEYICENNRVKIKEIPYPGILRQLSFYTYLDLHTNIKIDYLDHHHVYAIALFISMTGAPSVLHLGHEIDRKPHHHPQHHIKHYDCYKILIPMKYFIISYLIPFQMIWSSLLYQLLMVIKRWRDWVI